MKGNIFKCIFLILVVTFFVLIVASQSGYYENSLKKSTKLTQNAIEKFENDISEGKKIDLEEYINTKEINYNNTMSRIGDKCSKGIEKIISSGFKILFKYISNQIE